MSLCHCQHRDKNTLCVFFFLCEVVGGLGRSDDVEAKVQQIQQFCSLLFCVQATKQKCLELFFPDNKLYLVLFLRREKKKNIKKCWSKIDQHVQGDATCVWWTICANNLLRVYNILPQLYLPLLESHKTFNTAAIVRALQPISYAEHIS